VKPPLVIVGGHGSGEIAMSVFEAANEAREQWQIAGFLSDVCPPGERLGQHPVLGGTAEVADFVARGYLIHYTLHLNAKKKWERVEKLRSLHLPPEAHASAVHPRAHVEPSTRVGPGVVVCAQAATSFGVQLGGFVHMYTNAFVGHDTVVSDYATLAAHSVLGARIRAGEGCHVGLNCSVREDLGLGEYSIVGMGAVVLADVAPFEIVGGNPARPLGNLRST
jgi:sugar O-acyltransferase (sialic acid O-acetyltransferase NeuD family)